MTTDNQFLVGGKNLSGQTRTSLRAWTVTALLMAFMVINFADKILISLAGPEIQADLGIGPAQFGLLQSSFYWLFGVGAIVIGAMSTRINNKWLLAGLVAVWVATAVPLTGAVGFGVLVACRVILGFAEGPAFALANHVAHSWFPPHKRALPSALIVTGAEIGPLLGAPALTWVIATYDWHAGFLVIVIAGIVWLALWSLLGKSGHQQTTDQHTTQNDSLRAVDKVPYRVLLTLPTILGAALLTFLGYTLTALKVTWLAVYLREGLGYGATAAGWLLTLPYALSAVFALSTAALSNHLASRGVSRRICRGFLSVAVLMGSGVSMLLFTVIGEGILQMILITLSFSLYAATYAIAFSAVSDIAPQRQRGFVLSLLIGVASLAGIIVPWLLGKLVAAAETPLAGYTNGFFLISILLMVGGTVVALLIRPERDTRILAQHGTAGADTVG